MHPKRSLQPATDPVLTPRLVLTPVGLNDIDDLVLLCGDPEVAYWTGPWTRAAIEAWAADMADRWSRDGVGKWMARDRSDGSLVGRGGFSRFDLDGEMVLELGWAVRDARTGQGYATELGRAALAWAVVHQSDLPVVAFTEVHNRASRAVMERLGMRPAGIIRREGLVEGQSACTRTPPSPCTADRPSATGTPTVDAARDLARPERGHPLGRNACPTHRILAGGGHGRRLAEWQPSGHHANAAMGRMVVAGALVGLVAIWLPEVLGTGKATTKDLFGGATIPLATLLLIAAAETILTPASLGAGFVGGVIGPSMLIGSTLGSAVGAVVIAISRTSGCHRSCSRWSGQRRWSPGASMPRSLGP